MPLDLDDTKRQKTRWVPFDGHLDGVEILVEFFGTEEAQKFRNRLEADGITKSTRDDPLKINPGREAAFFRAIAARYVRDWRGSITPAGSAYDAEKMGAVLAAYPRAFEILMKAVGDENGFFVVGSNGSMPS
jgi:hypothetical protein